METIDINKNEVALIEEKHGNSVAIFSTDAAQFYSSFKPATVEDKAKLLNAMANPTYKLENVVGLKAVLVKDIVAHRVQMTDMNTGEIIVADRVVLICPNGETVAGVSKGFKGGVSNIINIFGQPASWENPLLVVLTNVRTRSNNMTYNLNVVLNTTLPIIGKDDK